MCLRSLFFLFLTAALFGQEELPERSSVTSHSVAIQDRPIDYEATAGTFTLSDGEKKPEASIFYVAYTKKGEGAKEARPLTFCFNGGPGSSSVWLHMGAFGPRRVAMDIWGYPERPYHLEENAYSILDKSDLVFIDPVSTGFSRAAPGADPKKFHSVEGDIRSIGEFIRLYLSRNERWTSPIYIAGESYGSTRAAGLANYLHNELLIDLEGVILVSSVLNFQAYRFDRGNDLPYLTFLPSYMQTAWYHKKLAKEDEQNLSRLQKEVVEFAMKEYALALMQGDRLPREEKLAIAKQLSRFTGLSEEYILRSNLRVNIFRFAKELLRDEKRSVGRFDSRFQGIDYDSAGEYFDYDPSFEVIAGSFASTFNQYIRKELNWKAEEEYEVMAEVSPWDFGKATNQYLNVGEELREVMTKNPHLKVFVASGYYDLATPYFATEYTFNHLGLDSSLQHHATFKRYDAGHMMYIHKPSLIKLKKDLAEFFDQR